jgi:hypothetical protein
MTCKYHIQILCSLLVLLFSTGCSITNEGVWHDIPDLNPKNALILAQDQEGPASFPPQDLVEGRGRVVQMGRRLVMLVEVLDDEEAVVDSGRVTCLYPALEPSRYDNLPCNVSSGKTPDYFFPTIAGMRQGGVRQIILPRTHMPPDSAKRYFIDAVTGNRLCEMPVDREVKLRISVNEVRRPKIVIMTSYSIPAMRDRRVVELWSW